MYNYPAISINSGCGCGCGGGHRHNGPLFSENCGCNNTGCPIQLDFTCILYHKNNNDVSKLTNLGLTNGATLQLFAETVDVKVGVFNALIPLANTALVATDSSSIDFSTSGTLSHQLTGAVKISAVADNQTQILSDGLHTGPQTLAIDYVNYTLSISDGNTVNFDSIVNNGWLGNLSSDPTTIDGKYWYNTTSLQLKIRLNGATRVITIV